MKSLLIEEVLSYIHEIGFDFKYEGSENLRISYFSSIDNLKSNEISWIKQVQDYDFNNLDGVEDALIICNETDKVLPEKLNFIKCSNPKAVFFSILEHYFKQEADDCVIQATAIVESKTMGDNVSVGHNSYIGKHVQLGSGVTIKNNVSIEGNVTIGDNTIIHSGTIIGKSGFGYYKDADGKYQKVPHYGGVVIGKHVEIGANVCIDKGALDNTVIEDYVKINNKCHIAHNVSIGENSLITAGVLISGSTIIDSNVYIAPGSVIRNQLSIGKNSYVGMGSVVVKNVDSNTLVMGAPAKEVKKIGDE